MPSKIKQTAGSVKGRIFTIAGQIQREQADLQSGEFRLMAYVFDKAGSLLGSEALDEKGGYNVAVKLRKPADVDLFVGPADMAEQIRSSSAFSHSFSAGDWKGEGGLFRLRFDTLIPVEIWRPWWPLRICVSGHVRKVSQQNGATEICPVPFVKVEIFDVDREFCYWPYLRNWWELLLDRPVFRIPDLLRDPPIPIPPLPGPDPAPDLNFDPIPGIRRNFGGSLLERVGLNPQPLPPREVEGMAAISARSFELRSQPDLRNLASAPVSGRVGEARLIDKSIASRLDKLTLTSKIAPWVTFSKCFYSKVEVCETTTDCDGYFNCCFTWWPFHFRFGRLRYDQRPDIIIKVTQVINGVPTVIYMDPYTSTRWNATSTHIDLFLDNEEIVCGSGNCVDPLPGSPVFFTRIGDDEVYKINQFSGLYNEAPLANVAYGSSLLVYGQFGDNLTSGAQARYYRLSYAKEGSSEFTPVTANMEDTRVAKSTLFSETHKLGPLTVNGVPALYEVRNFGDYYWYNPDWLGTWYSWLAEPDTGKYILRLEVFDQNGAKLTTAMGVDYRDGTVAPPAVLPPMLDRCDLVILLDNKGPVVNLTIPAVLNDCGVIPFSSVPPLDFQVNVLQENGRLHSWGLYYTKGVLPGVHYLAGPNTFNAGTAGPITPTVSGAAMLVGLTSTCAFALKLWATAHVRDGRNFIFYDEQLKAIAIEKCGP
jgi:hypothetical protein